MFTPGTMKAKRAVSSLARRNHVEDRGAAEAGGSDSLRSWRRPSPRPPATSEDIPAGRSRRRCTGGSPAGCRRPPPASSPRRPWPPPASGLSSVIDVVESGWPPASGSSTCHREGADRLAGVSRRGREQHRRDTGHCHQHPLPKHSLSPCLFQLPLSHDVDVGGACGDGGASGGDDASSCGAWRRRRFLRSPHTCRQRAAAGPWSPAHDTRPMPGRAPAGGCAGIRRRGGRRTASPAGR